MSFRLTLRVITGMSGFLQNEFSDFGRARGLQINSIHLRLGRRRRLRIITYGETKFRLSRISLGNKGLHRRIVGYTQLVLRNRGRARVTNAQMGLVLANSTSGTNMIIIEVRGTIYRQFGAMSFYY